MAQDTIFKKEEKQDIDRFAMLIKNTTGEQQEKMRLVIQSVNLGIEIGKSTVVCN